jgi:hypothetical protein
LFAFIFLAFFCAGVCGTPEGLVEYQRFLEYHSARFELILVVAGTHEFFNIRDASGDNSKEPVSVAEISARIEQVCSQISGVYFLNDSSVIVNDVQFSGCTLWSEIPSEYSSAVEAVLNEFQMIYTEADDGTKRLITAQDTTRWHRKSAEFLTTSARQVSRALILNSLRLCKLWLILPMACICRPKRRGAECSSSPTIRQLSTALAVKSM